MMTHYEVSNSVGSFQSEDIDGQDNAPANGQPDNSKDASKTNAGQAQQDTAFVIPMRPAATRHKATQKSTYQK
jgi:hypothetical protein